MKKGISKQIYQNDILSEFLPDLKKQNAQENPNSFDIPLQKNIQTENNESMIEPPSVTESPPIKQDDQIYSKSGKHVSVDIQTDISAIKSPPITDLNSSKNEESVNISKNFVQEKILKNEQVSTDDTIRASTIIPSKRDIPIGLRISQFITV